MESPLTAGTADDSYELVGTIILIAGVERGRVCLESRSRGFHRSVRPGYRREPTGVGGPLLHQYPQRIERAESHGGLGRGRRHHRRFGNHLVRQRRVFL